jgi:MYXO-CTERM domain-containing protein
MVASSWSLRIVPLIAMLSACGGGSGESISQTPRLLPPETIGAQVMAAVQHDESAPLALMPAPPPVARPDLEPMRVPFHNVPLKTADLNVQTSAPQGLMPTPTVAFEAQGQGFTGPSGSFTIIGVPPDTNGDVGPNHYVQTVNSDVTVFDKTGKALYGPAAINTLFSGFGGMCEQHNDGDPVVLYDPMADRWVISQFAVTVPTTPGGTVPAGSTWFHCVAVSKTADPTGAYYRYAFQYDHMNDYPKMGVWPDAYYQTFNFFDMTTANSPFVGAKICAYDRASMLQGKTANQQCFLTNSNYGAVLPSDLDGRNLPPAGAPNTLVGLVDNNNFAYWQFHVDWTNSANTKLTGPVNIAVPAYTPACPNNQENTCIPQKGTTQQLDALSDRAMFRLAYRHFTDHESMVFTHSVVANNGTGIRWYELRMQNGVPVIYQQGTYAPDSNYRWLGSAAMDGAGNILVGYSLSGAQMKPAIHLAGRLAGDPLNQLARGETSLIDGAGAQLPLYGGLQPLSRWGDYSMMSVDPSDDCTFWFTNEYIQSDGSANWHTRVGTIQLPGCLSPITPPGTPSAQLSFPVDGAILAGTITLSGEASSPHAITALEFLVDGTTISTSNVSPATATWDSTKVADGSHQIGVRATDSSGWIGSSLVNVTVSNSTADAGTGGGGNCPPGTVNVGGTCIPTGCSSRGSGYSWIAALGLAAAVVLIRRRRR